MAVNDPEFVRTSSLAIRQVLGREFERELAALRRHLFDPSLADVRRCVYCSQEEGSPIHKEAS